MTARICIVAITATVLVGCNSLLGLNKEPSLVEPIDAAIDKPIDAPIDMPIDMNPAACPGMDCGDFGCDTQTNTCRPKKLWVYLSLSSFPSNGFGGLDNPPDVRDASDSLCAQAAASPELSKRACSVDRAHAILTVSTTDSIQAMRPKYMIPDTVEIHRADDDVLVANNWNVLTMTMTTLAPVVSPAAAPTEADGVVWTGFGPSTASNCLGWQSNANAQNGVVGHTTISDANSLWLGKASIACGAAVAPQEHLLCVCWSGGK
jgi:hypothetical protein